MRSHGHSHTILVINDLMRDLNSNSPLDKSILRTHDETNIMCILTYATFKKQIPKDTCNSMILHSRTIILYPNPDKSFVPRPKGFKCLRRFS